MEGTPHEKKKGVDARYKKLREKKGNGNERAESGYP